MRFNDYTIARNVQESNGEIYNILKLMENNDPMVLSEIGNFLSNLFNRGAPQQSRSNPGASDYLGRMGTRDEFRGGAQGNTISRATTELEKLQHMLSTAQLPTGPFAEVQPGAMNNLNKIVQYLKGPLLKAMQQGSKAEAPTPNPWER